MQKLQKFFTVLLSAAIVFSILGFTPAFDKPKVDITEPVTLTWYIIGNGPQQDTAQVEKKIHDYLMSKYKMNTSVKLICYDWGDYDQKMDIIINSRQKFDICFTSYWTNDYYTQAPRGAFLPLNELLPAYAPKTKAILGDDFLKGSQVNGINYAIPANKEKAQQVGLFLRKDLVDKYNMDITKIKQFSDIEPLLARIKANEPEVEPLEVLLDDASFSMLFNFDFIGDGVDICPRYPGVIYSDSKDMKVFNEFEKPEYMRFFKTIHKFYTLGYLCKECEYSYGQEHLSGSGEVFAALKRIYPMDTYYLNAQTGYEWIAVPLSHTVMTPLEATGSMQAVSATSPHPERALMFLELVNTDEYLNNLINFGVENVHYVKSGKKSIELTDAASNYSFQMGWMFGNELLNYALPGQSPDSWNVVEAFNAKAQPSKTLGFVFDRSNVEREIQVCNNVWREYMSELTTGTQDPEIYLPQMIDTLKKVGSDKIIAEKQRQLDEWLVQASK